MQNVNTNDKKFTKPERSWIMYDWANSVYATIIMAAVFPIYFTSMVPDGDMWWGYATSIATFTIAILAPILGAMADYKGMKKKFLIFFLAVGVLFTATMAIPGAPWQLLLVGYIFSYIGFSGSCLFYDSFLTDVTTHERMDRVSATGYAMGYIGGSTIPFIISIALIFLMPDNQTLAIQISIVITSLWWALFSIPILKNVQQTHSLGELPRNFIGETLRNVWHTFKSIFVRKGLFLFILAYFFYIDGVNTVIHMSTAYGTTLGLSTTGMILALLVTQVVAAPFSVLFARIAKKIGSVRMLTVAVAIYFIICTVGFYMGYSLEPSQYAAEDAYTQAFDTAAGTVDPDSDLAALRTDGLAVLNSAERTENFQALLDSDNYAGVDQSTRTALAQAMAPVLDGITADGSYDKALLRSNILFWCMAVLVGTCQGGIQALSRSYFGRLIPPERSNEYFGFFDIFGKFAAVIGPALYGIVKTFTGRSSFGILSLMILFLLGGAILLFGHKTIQKEEHNTPAPPQ